VRLCIAFGTRFVTATSLVYPLDRIADGQYVSYPRLNIVPQVTHFNCDFGATKAPTPTSTKPFLALLAVNCVHHTSGILDRLHLG
jgi:hypothetical protein